MGKLFIFDMGEVLILNVKNLQAIAERFSLDYKPFRAFYGLYDKDLMEGKMESMDFFGIMEKKYNIKINENLFIRDFHPLPNPYMMETIDKLREKGHLCVLGSNTFEPHMTVVEKMEEKPLSHLDHLYLSYKMGVAKPSPDFFLHILEKEKVSPEDTVFIDDRAYNTDVASSLGIKTLLYDNENKEENEEFFKEYLE